MLFAYLKVMVPGQRNQSCLMLGEGLLKYRPVVVYVGLDAPMVVHLGDVLPTSCGSRPIRLGLKSYLPRVTKKLGSKNKKKSLPWPSLALGKGDLCRGPGQWPSAKKIKKK